MNEYADKLNEEQLKPVMDTEGAVLVTAGAGSGKTRLLTYRIAHLIKDLGVKPYNVLAITFTNKAAREMRDRLDALLGPDAESIWVHTFHAMCVRILRRYITNLGEGFTTSFSIYGEQEREQLIKRLAREVAGGGSQKGGKKSGGDDDEREKLRALIASAEDSISRAKNDNISPDDFCKVYEWKDDVAEVAAIYERYEKALVVSNALDYDDLLIKAYRLLTTDAEARSYYQSKFHYIHVDEFQDTNRLQYDLIKVLGAKFGNVFVVGDEDQSIYGWRGANYANIFDFTQDYDCKIYKLERNYRSTKSVLDLANKIIRNNKSRLDKTLWTSNGRGEPVKFYAARSDTEEADFVVRTIEQLHRDEGYAYSDFAVLMRINALSRSFEERMMQYGIPNRIYGGFKFYDRKEVKDLLAYFRMMGNHSDEDAILRVINFPRRGIGDGTVAQLVNYARVTGATLYSVVRDIDSNPDLPNGVIKKVAPFGNVVRCLEAAAEGGGTLYDLGCYVIKVIGLREYYAEDTDENASRKNNIRELLHGMNQFEQSNPGAGLNEYLQMISLYSDLDEMTDEADCVSLATIHSAKGLEFRVVFAVGLEEEIFPSARRVETPAELEEERRLMYVAVTRARERLYLTMAQSRFRYGERNGCLPSRFLEEAGFTDKRERQSAYSAYSGRYDSYRGSRSYASGGKEYNPEEVPSYSAPSPSAAPKPTVSVEGYAPGVKVRHKKFGVGTVVAVSAAGEPCLDVYFEGLGKLKLLLAYAPIEIVK